jgi:hypothetical protein
LYLSKDNRFFILIIEMLMAKKVIKQFTVTAIGAMVVCAAIKVYTFPRCDLSCTVNILAYVIE